MRLCLKALCLAILLGFHISYAQQVEAKFPLVFNIPDDVKNSLTPEQFQLLQNLKAQAEKEIQQNQLIEFNPPQSIFSPDSQIISIGDLLRKSSSGELELQSLSKDENGNKVALNEAQWSQIENEGLFIVPSKAYPGMNHVWKLVSFFQIGRKNIQISLKKSNATSIGQIIIAIPRNLRFKGPQEAINLKYGLLNIGKGLRNSISLLVGLIEKKPKYDSYALEQEISKIQKKYILDSIPLSSQEKVAHELGFTPDLRLYDPEISGALNLLYKKFNLAEVSSEYWEENYAPRINQISPGLNQLIKNEKLAEDIIQREEGLVALEVSQKEKDFAQELLKTNPIKSQVSEWLNREVKLRSSQYYLGIRDARYKQIADKLRLAGLLQQAYFFEKNYEFVRDMQDKVSDELKAQYKAANEYVYGYRIYNPKNWEIVKDEESGYYSAQIFRLGKVDSLSLFWRLNILLKTSRALIQNLTYGILYENLWNGPVGVRSLFEKEAFTHTTGFDYKTGKLIEGTEKTETMRSRYLSILEDQKKEREIFEKAPDNGFFGKRFSRLFMNTRHAATKVVGGAFLFVGQPVATTVNAGFSTILVGTSIVWAPVASLMKLGYNAAVLDTTSKNNYNNYFITRMNARTLPLAQELGGRFALAGVGQTIGSILTSIGRGLFAGGNYVVGNFIAGEQNLSDQIMLKFMKKLKPGIPSQNQAGVVRRIEGPGLSNNYFYTLDTDLVKLLLWAKLEQIRFLEYSRQLSVEINKPIEDYDNFVSVFGEFAGLKNTKNQINDNIRINDQLRYQPEQALVSLYQKLLKIESQGSSIKFSQADLQKILEESQVLVEYFFTQNKLDSKNVGFSKYLNTGDFKGLTSLLLTKIFGTDVLVPFEEADKKLKLDVRDPKASDHLNALLSGEKLPTTQTDLRVKPEILRCAGLFK